MKTVIMKKMLPLLTALLISSNLFAAAINKIIFFGDSLTDNGNLYKLLKVIPPSPPYYNGRFTNGPTWAEILSSYYYHKYSISYEDYAYGGATAINHGSNNQFLAPTSLEGELYEYYANSFFSKKSNKLYVIWIGANDYLMDENADADALTTEVVQQISLAILSLLNQGGRYFLVLNLPDLATCPFARQNQLTQRLHLLTEMHNQKLAKAVENLNRLNTNISVTLIDTYTALNDLLNNPQKYNLKYKKNITILNQACWLGGMSQPYHSANTGNMLTAHLNNDLQHTQDGASSHFNTHAVVEHVLHSPDLTEALIHNHARSTALGLCYNPEQYVFWDKIHPSAAVHQILSAIVIETLDTREELLG